MRLTDDEREILAFLNQKGEGGEYQLNTWAIDAGSIFTRGRDLQSLKRRGLVDAEGRGNQRQWWITEAGKEVLA